MVRRKIGRRKGIRTKGYFYRAKRGWYTKLNGKFVPLVGDDGERLRDPKLPERTLKEAYAHFMMDAAKRSQSSGQSNHTTGSVQASNVRLGEVEAGEVEVGEACAAYLDHLRREAGISPDSGAVDKQTAFRGPGKTYIDRGQTLFDFCFGLPGEYFCAGDKAKRAAKADAEAKRIHAGYGAKLCSELTPGDIDQWVGVHSWNPGGRRTRVQAVKRALNFAVERKLIAANPIRGYKLPKSGTRVTYLSPQQEAAMIEAASPAFAVALKVCIRTGARFGCEFAALRPRHVRDLGDKMEWTFKPREAKTGRLRIIRITDPEVLQLVRAGLQREFVFLNQQGTPWTREILSHNFRRTKLRLKRQGIQLDADACMYSCRHTYAKRILEGYWNGKPASINTLARLMGNSVPVCIEHYLQFSVADNEMLWGAA